MQTHATKILRGSLVAPLLTYYANTGKPLPYYLAPYAPAAPLPPATVRASQSSAAN